MCGNLQDRIRGGVENGMTRVGMLRAELFQNRRPATSIIADKLHTRLTLDRVDQFVGKSGKDRKRNIDDYAGDLPMTGRGVFTGGALLHFAEAGEVGQAKTLSRPGIFFIKNLGQPERAEIRQPSIPISCKDVTESVSAFVSIFSGIRRMANADGIQNNEQSAHTNRWSDGVLE